MATGRDTEPLPPGAGSPGPCGVTSRGPRPPDWLPPPPVSRGRLPVPDPCAGAVPGLPHSLQGPPCARSSADVPGSAPSPPRSDSASAARARPRRLPSASPASPRGREQRAAPAAMRGECASARPGRVPPELPASPLTPGHPPASFSAPLSSPQARPCTDGACSARGRLQGPRFLPPPRDVRPARPGPPLQNRDVQLGSGGVWGAFGGFF